jgi:hypothetical protein
MPMMANTTNNSTSVKADEPGFLERVERLNLLRFFWG